MRIPVPERLGDPNIDDAQRAADTLIGENSAESTVVVDHAEGVQTLALSGKDFAFSERTE
jgi:hypothetical protein